MTLGCLFGVRQATFNFAKSGSMRKAPLRPRAARHGIWVSVLGLLGGCHLTGPQNTGASNPKEGMTCQERKADLTTFVRYLPDTALTASVHVALPEASLGGVPRHGALIELAPTEVAFEGERFAGESLKARVDWLASKLTGLSQTGGATKGGEPKPPLLHVAASYDLDVRTLREYLSGVPKAVELRLLFRVPTVRMSDQGDADARAFASQLLAERDPERRRALTREGFSKYSSCDATEQALRSVEQVPEEQRWPRLKQALSTALAGCDCSDLDAPSLKQIVVAEQRAGTMALGSMPLSFIRDERCGASMPLRSMQKLLGQVEKFDQEFSGQWHEDELSFDKVVTNERLLNYFCDALPGETLAALQRARSTLYWRFSDGQCQGWRFEPLSPGAPMGTWRRVVDGPGAGSELAFHYWQGAEQIRVYGPVPSPESKPTDRERWACEVDYEMKAVDASSVRLTGGSWFFSYEACQRAPARAALASSCVVEHALGAASAQEGAIEGADAPP